MSAVFYFELNTLPNILESRCSGDTVPSDPEPLIVNLGFVFQNANGESPFDFFFFIILHASGGSYEFNFLSYLRARGKGDGVERTRAGFVRKVKWSLLQNRTVVCTVLSWERSGGKTIAILLTVLKLTCYPR